MVKTNDGLPRIEAQFACLGDRNAVTATEETMLEAVIRAGGLLTVPEVLTLYRICRRLSTGSRILEIGSFLGGSTTAIGHAILGRGVEMYCIDCWSYPQDVLNQFVPGTTAADHDIFSRFQNNTSFLGEQLRIMKGTTEQFFYFMPTGFFDLVFVDAGHDYKSVVLDILLGLRVLRPGGLICGHDFHNSGEGVRKAVNALIGCSSGIQICGVVPDTTIWYGIVDDPVYEHARSAAFAKALGGETGEAVKMAFRLLKEFPDREDSRKIVDDIISIKYS